jgi:sulfate permease, SulP family
MLTKVFPFTLWLKRYSAEKIRLDAVSGLTVALVLIPQSMAYAQLAGLPAYYGLYAAFLPPMVAALFGSSHQLATGPVAVVSLMTSASLSPLATAGSEGYIAYAILLALMVGVLQFALGVLRLGLVVNFLSHPVVNGFTNAAAIIIATSQLSKIFGVSVESASHHYETVMNVFREAACYTHWPTFFMGASAFAIMYGLKRLSPKIPNVLVAVALTTIISWAIGFQHNRVADLSAVESSEAKALVVEFDKSMQTMDRLGRERTEVSKALEQASSGRDSVAVLNAEHAASVLAFHIESVENEIQITRQKIRRLLLKGVKQRDGSMKFYLAAKIPPGAQDDGRTWRIKVGQGPLITSRLPMMGGGEVVGTIPKGLPSLSIPHIDWGVIFHLLPYAAIISLLGFMEAISIAKAMAAKTGQRLDPNQELIGQGLANILGSTAKSYPTSGSFSRSAVNLQSGAVTGFSSVFTSLMVVIVLMFFTPLLYHLPQSVLAAVIMMAVIGLINVSGFIHAWEAKWYDGVISVLSFVATLGFAPHLDRGIAVGVVLSLLVFLYKSMRPRVATLSRYDDQSLRDCATFGLRECEHIAMIRFDGPLFFANSSYLEDIITERMRNKKNLKHIVLVANGVNDMDASGEETLSLLVDRVRSAGVDFSLSSVNEKVTEVLRRTHLWERIGDDHIYPTMEKAVSAVYTEAHKENQEQICPLMTVCRIDQQT